MAGAGRIDEKRVRLERSPRAAGRARRLVEQELERHDVGVEAVEMTKLVASELVTNAIRHGEGQVEIRLALAEDRIRVEVIDEGTADVPSVRQQPSNESGGWGLQIIDHVSHQWGVFEGTTHVWADLKLDRPAGACAGS